MHKHAGLEGSGGMHSQEITCSEIACEVTLGQKQSCSSCAAGIVLHPIFSCPNMHLPSKVTPHFYERRYYNR